jgi:hypothetical protein
LRPRSLLARAGADWVSRRLAWAVLWFRAQFDRVFLGWVRTKEAGSCIKLDVGFVKSLGVLGRGLLLFVVGLGAGIGFDCFHQQRPSLFQF